MGPGDPATAFPPDWHAVCIPPPAPPCRPLKGMHPMTHSLRNRFALLASGFALTAALAAPAEAQRRTDWHIGVGRDTRHGHVGVTIGSRGVGVTAGYHRHPVVCPPSAPAGHWETRYERVWVPGAVRRVWVPPCYATRYDACGRPYQALVHPGHWDTIQDQGCWESRPTRVWVPHSGHAHGRRWR